MEIDDTAMNDKNKQLKTTYNIRMFEEMRDFIITKIIAFDEARLAVRIIGYLNKFFKKNPQFKVKQLALYNEFQHILILLRWTVLPTLLEAEIIYIFEHEFVEIFEIPSYSIWTKFRAHLSSIVIYEDRDDFKEKVRNALFRNKQELTEDGVIVDTHEQKGTVGNWIKDYINKFGGSEKVNDIDFVKYITINLHDYSDEDKQRVLTLLNFYERLKYSSLEPEGIEGAINYIDTDDGHHKVFYNGQIDDVDANKELNKVIKDLQDRGVWPKDEKKGAEGPKKITINASQDQSKKIQKSEGETKVEKSAKIDNIVSVDPIVKAYNALPVSMAEVKKQMPLLLSRLESQPQLLKQILSNTKKVKDPAFVIAALLLLAQRGELSESKNQPELKEYVRDILEDKLGWSAEDSAKIGVRLGSVLGGAYRGWAHYSKGKKMFEWVK